VDFPRSMMDDPSYNFSFSGIKTAVRYLVQGVPPKNAARVDSANPKSKIQNPKLPDLCASFQEAVVDVLIGKTLRAAREKASRIIAVSGGVACNSRLRAKLAAVCAEKNLALHIAHPRLCTDNAAMIAALAALKLERGQRSDWSLDVQPSLALQQG
jgi:N6-L-threonylcarbamoyladenine synthase